ncbi:MAG: F0F1 ATP synthase subunit epsilon [Neomegalonema sp.]|nr:F0F1 ATP synthase subunit epsilon [Neomegalonema sp.]
MATLQFDLVSPERNMASAVATLVVVPGADGELGIMPGHAPYLTTLRPGIVTATVDGAEQRFVVFGGFVEVSPSSVSVLAEEVHPFSELEPHTLEERIKDAEEAVATSDDDDVHRHAQHLLDLRTLKSYRAQA